VSIERSWAAAVVTQDPLPKSITDANRSLVASIGPHRRTPNQSSCPRFVNSGSSVCIRKEPRDVIVRWSAEAGAIFQCGDGNPLFRQLGEKGTKPTLVGMSVNSAFASWREAEQCSK